MVSFLSLNFEVHEQVGSLHNDFIPLMASANQHILKLGKVSMNTTHEQVVHYKNEKPRKCIPN